jgi:hypothetical protein
VLYRTRAGRRSLVEPVSVRAFDKAGQKVSISGTTGASGTTQVTITALRGSVMVQGTPLAEGKSAIIAIKTPQRPKDEGAITPKK